MGRSPPAQNKATVPAGVKNRLRRDRRPNQLRGMNPAPAPHPTARRPAADVLDRTTDWLFDLDNTLYPAAESLFVEVGLRIRDYIADRLGLDPDEARRLQRRYFEEYGTSLRGLMVCHGMDPEPFLDYVHDVDIGVITPNPSLDAALGRLGGRKIIFTNASRDHAERIVERLGIRHHFEAVFDIADADFVPKPEPGPYDALVRRYGIRPEAAVMIDDMARNLAPAATLGMTTVWLRNDTDWGREGADGDYIHHVAENLVDWLDEAAGPSREAPPCPA